MKGQNNGGMRFVWANLPFYLSMLFPPPCMHFMVLMLPFSLLLPYMHYNSQCW